jgi:hypothetical protein
MTRRTDPSQRLVLVLDSDKDLPPEQQPKFFARVLRVRQAEQLQDLRNQQTSNPITKAVELVMMFLAGWENVSHPDTGESLEFSAENLKEVLTLDQLTQVVEFAIGTIQQSIGDQKKSE